MIKNNSGSILIWSLFLVLFVATTFIYITTWVNLQIQDNDNISNSALSYTSKNYKPSTQENSYSSSEKFKIQYFDSFVWSLKSSETLVFKFNNSNTWSFLINYWWPIYFETYSWSTIFNSWIINSSLSSLSLTWNLSLKNLWGFTNFTLSFSSWTWIIFPYNYYQITKTIWWKSLVKEFWEY